MHQAPTMKSQALQSQRRSYRHLIVASATGLLCVAAWVNSWPLFAWMPALSPCHFDDPIVVHSPYGTFPRLDDPFLLLPCTNATLPPVLDDDNARSSWIKLFDPNPEHWSWGGDIVDQVIHEGDPYAGRGIYLCGYLDVPLDYLNRSESRIVRLAVTKFQVSGLAREDGTSVSSAGHKSARTLVVEPGGPGGSGTSYVWREAERVTRLFSQGQFDVLGWDPRGVNTTLPAISCFPYDADRDHWAMLYGRYREGSPSPRAQLELDDAMNDAIFRACWEIHGDLPRFMSTASVARDMEEIRIALKEDELTGYLVSYGTGIGQTYANMFPGSVGRMVLDGTEYVRDHRLLGGFGWTALDNVTDAWHDGFLGECINSGPEYCALAEPVDSQAVTIDDLEERIKLLLESLLHRPIAAYTEFSGPSLITYSSLVALIYACMYDATTWPILAIMLSNLEAGNSTLAATLLEYNMWEYDPTLPVATNRRPSSDELGSLVICADAYDAPLPPGGLDWWESLWANMTQKSWISGNSRFANVFPCRHFVDYWPEPAEVYRGDLDHKLHHPVLLIAETYDPATPLRNGRRLFEEMGENARLIVHHGYGHSSRDSSNCTDSIAARFILTGEVPDEQETNCYADEKPFLYGTDKRGRDPGESWRKLVSEHSSQNPRG